MKLSSPELTRTRCLLIALAAITCVVYSNTLWNGFTLDERFVYADNHFTQRLSNLPKLFDSAYFQYSHETRYRPVEMLTYFFDAALWRGWAGGAHLTNLALTVATVWVLFAFFRSVTGNQAAGFLGAGLFALHPIHTEVINNIAFRDDLLVSLLIPAAWLLYKPFEQGRSWFWLPLAWCCYLLALFSKEMAVVFPLLAVLVAWTEADGQFKSLLTRRKLLFLTGLIVLTLFFVVVRLHWMRSPGEVHTPYVDRSLLTALLADVKLQAFYLRLLFFPHPLVAQYPPSFYQPSLDAAFFISLAALLVLAAFVLYFRRARFLVCSVFWWFISLAPVANTSSLDTPMAERYLILPSIGPILWAGWVLSKGLQTKARPVVLALIVCIGLAFGALTLQRNPDWRDSVTLWSATVAESPQDPQVLANLAVACFQKGDFAAAIANAKLALKLSEINHQTIDFASVYLCLGCSHLMLNKHDLALRYLRKAEAQLPARFDVEAATYRNLGTIYDERNDLHAALRYYLQAVDRDPYDADLWLRICSIETQLGNRAHALKSWQTAHQLDPSVASFEQIERLHPRSLQQPHVQ